MSLAGLFPLERARHPQVNENSMAIESPKSPQEAFHQVIVGIGNLAKKLSGINAGEVFDAIEIIEEIWAKQDMDKYPIV